MLFETQRKIHTGERIIPKGYVFQAEPFCMLNELGTVRVILYKLWRNSIWISFTVECHPYFIKQKTESVWEWRE